MAAEVFRRKIGGSPFAPRAFLRNEVARISRRFLFEILNFAKSGFFGSMSLILKISFGVKTKCNF